MCCSSGKHLEEIYWAVFKGVWQTNENKRNSTFLVEISENLQKQARFVQGLEVICPQVQCVEVQALNKRGVGLKKKTTDKRRPLCTRLTGIGKPFQKQEPKIDQGSWEL